MSTDLLSELSGLVSSDSEQIEYAHELALSALTNDIARIMRDQGVSQSELARRLGVSRARVSQLMCHKSSPTLHTVVEVARALGCDMTVTIVPSHAVGGHSRATA